MKLIDKDKIVEEIERRIEMTKMLRATEEIRNARIDAFTKILSFLNTLETKEVDLDNELDFVKDAYYYFTSDERSSMKKVAKHFFELGLKTKKE